MIDLKKKLKPVFDEFNCTWHITKAKELLYIYLYTIAKFHKNKSDINLYRFYR